MPNWKNNLFSLLIGIVVLWLSPGCGGKTMVLKYYLIELPALQDTTVVVKENAVNASCEIRPVETHPAFAGNEIARRSRSHELSYYAYHQWAVKPSEAIADILREQLDKSGLFLKTNKRFWGVNPDYALITRVEKLEVAEIKDTFYARLRLEFFLLDNASETVLIEHLADRQVPLKRKSINLFAYEISRLLDEEISKLTAKIREHITN
jgi:ABC-type uncharacterized transport system auxiliary subunit